LVRQRASMPTLILSGIDRRLLSAASDDGQELTLVVVEEAVDLPVGRQPSRLRPTCLLVTL
jgi:hypothetical protein